MELEAKKNFPDAEIIRLDSSVTRQKGSHEDVLKQFSDRKADILVGTQMLAKGIDLPYVTLVGVILADVGLGLAGFSLRRNGLFNCLCRLPEGQAAAH